ncbi:hypothetical protein DFH27DRAFT_558368 [Peziza echinospora]|nr:hypothetical protein DFH27DRAFT_558368 [Peziza echinospora]
MFLPSDLLVEGWFLCIVGPEKFYLSIYGFMDVRKVTSRYLGRYLLPMVWYVWGLLVIVISIPCR